MIWLLCMCVGSALAVDAEPLTYRASLEAAQQNNPTLEKTRISEAQAESSWKGARAAFDPTLDLSGQSVTSQDRGFFSGFPFDSNSNSFGMDATVRGNTATGTSWSLAGGMDRNLSTFVTTFGGIEDERTQDSYGGNITASVTQQLLKGVRMSYNLQNVTQARRGWEDATLRTEKARQDILSEVARAYWAWVYAFQQQEISEDAVVVAAEALRVGELKVEWGELAPVEKTRLQAAHVQAKSSALEAANAARETRDALLLLMGRAPGAELLPATPVGTVRDLAIDPVRAVEVAQAQNVDLILAQRALEQAELDEVNARHGMLPNLSATVATGSTSQVRFADGVGEEDSGDVPSDALTDLFAEPLPFMRVSGVLTVPLGNRAARTEREVAAFNVQIRRAELEEVKRSIESQVRSQVAVLTSARQRVDLADLNQRLAEETLSAEEALSEAGRTIQKDVLEARTEVSRTRAEAVKARTDYRMAYVELLKLQGQVSDDASEL